jgi:ketosteroid isomerase-like protein
VTNADPGVASDADEQARTNARVVRAFLEAIQARDIARVSETLSDDVVYHFPGENRLAGSYRGKPAVLSFLPQLPRLLDEPPMFDVHDVLSSEAHATDLSNYYGVRRGQRYSWRVVRVYHFKAGLISEIFVTVDDQAGLNWFLSDDLDAADTDGTSRIRK